MAAMSSLTAPIEAPAEDRSRRPRRGDIQGLRGIAVLTVCLSHAGMPFFDGGYVGVDVFFVISGFLITGILMRELARNGTFSLSDFYARRARRILPAAALVLVVTVLASWLTLGVVRLQEVLEDVVWAGLFAANIQFARLDDDYFAKDVVASPVRHYWSLAAEEQFYLVWPLLLLLVVHLVRKRKGLTGVPALKYVVYTLVAVTVISLAWCIYQTRVDQTFAYYAPMTRAWELGAGALLAVVEPRLRKLRWTTLNGLSLLGLLAIGFATIAYSDETPFPGHAALVPVLGACLVIAGGCTPAPRGASRALDRGPLRWAGDISYSLYLWHWPFLVIPALAGLEMSLLDNANMLMAAAALALVTERWVERPFRDGRFWRAPRLRSLALWPAAAGVVLAAVFAVQLELPRQSTPVAVKLDPEPPMAPRAGQPPPSASDHVVAAVRKGADRARADVRVPARLAPPLLELPDHNWSLPEHCWADTGKVEHQICSFGDPQADRTLVLLGDSHMGVWTRPLDVEAEKRGWHVQVLIKTGCPPHGAPMWREESDRRYTECDRYRDWALGRIRAIAPDRLAITGYTAQALHDPRTGRRLRDDQGQAGTRALVAGMRSALAELSGAADELVLIGDTNKLPARAADCLGERGARLGDCARGRSAAVARRTAMWADLTRRSGGSFVDVAPWLCQGGVCPLVVGNTIVYTDDNHLTREYAAALGPALADALGL